jgi:transcription initiation factor IIE alpha subunit
MTYSCLNLCVKYDFQANVMLEYKLDDAESLLKKNNEAAVKSLSQVEDDLGFIRDQTTTIEVSIL